MFNSPLNTYNVQTSFNQPASAYLPAPNADLNRQTINQANAQLFGQGDMRALMSQFLPSSNAGVQTSYQNEPGMASLLVAPRSQVASQVMQNNSGMPYAQNLQNFQALMNLQGANAGQALGTGQLAQNYGQAIQGYELGNFGSGLGMIQQLLSHLLGGVGNLTSGAMSGGAGSGGGMGGLGSLLGGGGGGLGSGFGSQVGIEGLTTNA